VLLVVGHPSIGAALETLLRIEDRFEVRRAQSIEQAVAGLDGWPADLALVDGVLVPNGRTEELAMPAIVLSGNAADGKRLASRFARGRGWLRKDATAEDLRAAIDHALRGTGPLAFSGGGRRAVLVLTVLALLMIALAIAWFLLRARG
jgi:DNA-binding NarL/FixJ family response regulator